MSPHAVAEHEDTVEVRTKEPIRAVATGVVNFPVSRKAMFEDSLLEIGGRKRRTWATIFSIILQCFLIGILILVPLLYTDVLPKQELITYLVAPPPPPPPPPPEAAAPAIKALKVVSEFVNGQLRAPSRIPTAIAMIKEPEAPPPAYTGGVVGGVPGGIPGGQLGGVIGGIISSIARTPSVSKVYSPPPRPTRIRVSQGVTRGLLIHKVEPSYPALAREARVQGTVVLTAIIARDGTIQNLQVVSGHPMLVPAAINAVQQWRFRPYLLNGQPVEVETTITVVFDLAG